jgi:predicted ATP-dependent endonuclease of OLD family
MSLIFPIKNLEINNYRAIKNLNLKLNRINLIGGVNGVGKSSIIECLFMILDRRNALAMHRPFLTKNTPLPYPEGLQYVFHNGDTKTNPIIKITLNGNTVTATYNKIDGNIATQKSAQNISPLQMQNFSANSVSEKNGIAIKCKLNDTYIDETIFFQSNPVEINHSYSPKVQEGDKIGKTFIKAAIIGPDQPQFPAEAAQRLSGIIKKGKLQSLIDTLKSFDKSIDDIEILVEGGQPTIYITMNDGVKRPLNLMGSGFQLLLTTALQLSFLEGGLLFFDEIDGAIHHSKQKLFWSILARLSNEYNTQVIGVTHSKEFVGNACFGLQESGHEKDFKYIRLDKLKTGSIDSVEYTADQIKTAIDGGWEIR